MCFWSLCVQLRALEALRVVGVTDEAPACLLSDDEWKLELPVCLTLLPALSALEPSEG
jgi:hypothetical protein